MLRTRRRHILMGLLALALGTLTTVGIAWWLALRSQDSYTFGHIVGVNTAPQGRAEYQGSFRVTDEYRPGFRRIEVRAMGTPLNALLANRVAADLEMADRTPAYALMQPVQSPQRPHWFSWVPRPGPADGAVDALSGRACGWPWYCLGSTRVHRSVEAAPRVSAAFSIVSASAYTTTSGSDPDRGAVPLMPIWPGFAGNVAVFSLPWVAVFFGAPAVRHLLRRRRGACVACGYDLRATPPNSPCPECGQPTPAR